MIATTVLLTSLLLGPGAPAPAAAADTLRLEVGSPEIDGRVFPSHRARNRVYLDPGKFNRILEIDYPNRAAVVQPGVTNLGISDAVADRNFYYAPDPSSQIACSIGGNVAENSGGVHCLKYGMTTNNILGVEMVMIDGEVVRIGGKHVDSGGYDLLALICGSDGLLGVVT
jgi:glycolate oxidase